MSNTNQESYDEEVSIRDLILKAQDYFAYFWRNKWWLLGAGLLGAAIFVYRIYDEEEVFNGSLSFVVEEGNSGGSSGGLGAVLGQIGLGGTTQENKLAKLSYLSRSHRVIYDVLIDSAEIAGKKDLLANHFIEIDNLGPTLLKISTIYEGFKFEHNHLDSLLGKEQTVLKFIYAIMVQSNDPLLNSSFIDETGQVTLEATMKSDQLALAMLYGTYNKLRDFYVESTSGRQQKNVNALRIRTDSIYKELMIVEYEVASLQDRSLGLTSRLDLVRLERLQRKASILNGLYLEVLKNRETADFLFKTSRPEFSIVEYPQIPLSSVKPGKKLAVVLGGLFGGFLMGLFLVLRKAYRDIMNEPTTPS